MMTDKLDLKRFRTRSQAQFFINHSIERGWREAKKLEGWTIKQINKSIEKLEHFKAAREVIEENRRKEQNERENDGEKKGVE